MLDLGKKLSSVLLCGSMAVTLLGNSGVHAANEVTEAVEDEFEEKVTAVDEHGNKVENDDEKNENTELDTNKGYQYVAEKDVAAQDPAKRSGSSFAVNVAKGLGTAALGTGIGFGLDEGWRRIGKDSSGNEEVSKDGTEIEELKIQVSKLQKKLEDTESELQKKLDDTESELQKKLEEAEKNPTVLGNLLWGASAGFWGFIPALRDKVGDALGRDIDSKSKESIIAAVIAETIGLSFAVWNIFKMFGIAGAKPVGWKRWTNSVSKTATDVLLPPVGLVWEFANLVINEFKGDESERISKIDEFFKKNDSKTPSDEHSQDSDF